MSIDLNLTSSKVDEKKVAEIQQKLKIYNKKEYLQAYKVFLMNGSVDYAYIVAKSAVEKRPHSLKWRQKLLQTSLWSNHPEKALEQYVYFIHANIELKKNEDLAIKLARQLNDYDTEAKIVKLQLAENPTDKNLILAYAIALQNQGFPKKARNYLLKIKDVEQDTQYLIQLYNIAQGLDEVEKQYYYAKLLWFKNPLNPRMTLDYANMSVITGKVEQSLPIFQPLIKHNDKSAGFWQQYVRFIELSGNNQLLQQAYRYQLYQNRLDPNATNTLISLEILHNNRERAYQDALYAYRLHKNYRLIPTIAGMAQTLQKWQSINDFLTTVPEQQLAKLLTKPLFNLVYIDIKAHVGLFLEAQRRWQLVFKRWPNLTSVRQAYLWFLIDINDFQQLDYSLKRWQHSLPYNSKLWIVYVSALTAAGDYQKALAISLQHLPKIKKSYTYMMGLADLFEQNNFQWQGDKVRKKAFVLLLHELKKSSKITVKQEIELTEISESFVPATFTRRLIQHLSQNLFMVREVDNVVMSWALKKGNYSLASYIANVHNLNHQPIPEWMSLTLAFIYNDRDSMFKLLRIPKKLPYRDRVTAAFLTGNHRLSQSYAYQGLKEHPQDEEMYKLYKQTMLPDATRFTNAFEEYSVGSTRGPLWYSAFRFNFLPSVSIIPYTRQWRTRTYNPEQIAWTPDWDSTTGVTFKKMLEKGWLSANIAERKNLETMFMAKFQWQRRFSARTFTLLSLGFHQKATEGEALIVGGMKNEIRALLTTSYDAHNKFDGQVNLMQFRGQDNSFLGTGEIFELHWQNKLYLTYPDWNINFYGTLARFQNNNSLVGLPLSLIVPNTITPTTQFFVPQSYTQAVITLGYGQESRKLYHYRWQSFAEAGLLYSIPFGLGEIAQGGFGGSVFGRDHLALYGQYSLNQQQAAQLNYTVGIRYDIYI